jgi:hypothetical protein
VIAIFPILIALAGLLMYLLAASPKPVELGRLLFLCGMLVTTYVAAAHVVKVF